MIVKDAMVLIHLAKITLLEKSCEYFRHVVVPLGVYEEISLGREKGYIDVKVIEDLVKRKKIAVKRVKNKKLLLKAKEFNIQRGEAEAVALYWQEKANWLASDDDNLRKKGILLDIKIIGTPAIILKLCNEKLIEKEKFIESLTELKKIGWFSNAIIDKILMEGKWEKQ